MNEVLETLIRRGNVLKETTQGRLVGIKGIASILESSGHPATAQRILSPMNQIFSCWDKFMEQHTTFPCHHEGCYQRALGIIQTMESLPDMSYDETILAELIEEEKFLRNEISELIEQAEASLEDKSFSCEAKNVYSQLDELKLRSTPGRSTHFFVLHRIKESLLHLLIIISALP